MLTLQLLTQDRKRVPGMALGVESDFLSLEGLPDRAMFTNSRHLWFPRHQGQTVTVTHLAILPIGGNEGIITRLTRPMEVRDKDSFSFPPGSVAISMDTDEIGAVT